MRGRRVKPNLTRTIGKGRRARIRGGMRAINANTQGHAIG